MPESTQNRRHPLHLSRGHVALTQVKGAAKRQTEGVTNEEQTYEINKNSVEQSYHRDLHTAGILTNDRERGLHSPCMELGIQIYNLSINQSLLRATQIYPFRCFGSIKI